MERPVWFDLLAGIDDDPAILPPDYDGSKTLADKGWKGMSSKAQEAYIALQKRAAEEGVSFFMTEGFRPLRRQAYLYTLGRTLKYIDKRGVPTAEPKDENGRDHRPQGTVTRALPGKSNHQGGRAFDIAIRVPKGGDPWDPALLTKVGVHAGEFGLQWGVDWDNDGKRDDIPHFQLLA